jgi:hypothetical protein
VLPIVLFDCYALSSFLSYSMWNILERSMSGLSYDISPIDLIIIISIYIAHPYPRCAAQNIIFKISTKKISIRENHIGLKILIKY